MYEHSYQINFIHLASKDAMVSMKLSPVTMQKQNYNYILLPFELLPFEYLISPISLMFTSLVFYC